MPRPPWTAPLAGDVRQWIVPIVLIVAAIVFPLLAPTYYVQFATKLLLLGMLAMALNLAVGFGGMVSMCHAAFFGLAGYALALLSPQSEPPSLWLTLPVAAATAALAAFVIGAFSLRTRGVYFIMVTLAFGEMLFYLFHDTQIAGGSDGAYIYFKPDLSIAGFTLLDLEQVRNFYWVVLLVVLGTILFLKTLRHSHFGHALAAARENERRARSLGFPIFRIRLTAFVISGALAGVAGYFAAAQYGFIAPQQLGWHLSALILVTLVLGGMRTVTGPLIGAFVLMGLEEVLKALTDHARLIEGLIIIAIVLLLPGGVLDLFKMAFGSSLEPTAAPRTQPTSLARPTREAEHA
jgi:branched-chain amino acid transport system permease protein